MQRLRTVFPDNSVGGHSLRSGGAMNLASRGVPPYLIQAIGRWASDSWQIYIRKHPNLQAALLLIIHPGADGPSADEVISL